MKTSRSHSRGDHVMERFHSAKHSCFGLWRCQPCAGDFVSPDSRAQKHRGPKKNRKDPNFDPDFVKSNKKVSEKEDRRDPNFDPEFVKSSQTAPAREDREGPANFTKGSQPTAAKPHRKDRSLRSLLNDSQQPKAREDHLLLENQSWRKEEDAEGNRKGESGKINEQLQPTHLEGGNELKPQDKNAKNLEGKDAAVPSPTDLPETESLKHSEPVNNTTISDEAAVKETPRKGSQSHQGQVHGEVQSKSQEDRHELESPNEDKENMEDRDAVPSHTGLAKCESLNQAEQVSSSPVSGEVGKENEQREDSPSQRADMNGQLPPTSRPDEHELKAPEENVGNLEETDAVPSQHSLSNILPTTEFLEHLEPDSKTRVSGEGAQDGDMVPPDDFQGRFSQSSKKGTRSVMQCAPEKDSQHEKHLQAESLEELDPGHKTIAAHGGAQGEVEHHLDSPPPEYLKQFSQTSEGEEGGKSIDMLIQYWEEKRKHNPEDVVHEGKFQHSGSQKLECPKEFSKADSKRLSRRGSRSGAEHLESPHNQGNLSKQSSDINEQLQPTHLEGGNELKPQDKNAKNLEGKDAAVPSPTDLPETESLKHSEPVNNTTISDEAAVKETPRKGSQSHQGQVHGEVQSKSQEDRHELESPNEDKENMEDKDAVPSHTGLAKCESLNQAEQVSSSSVSGDVGKENEQREDSPSQRADMNGQLPPTSRPDEHELKAPEENVGNLEDTDAVPSHRSLSSILPITEFLEHLEPDSKTRVSGEGAQDGDMVPPDDSQGRFSQSSKKGTRSVMQCAPEKDSQHEKHLQAESLEELDPGHKTIAAHGGAQGEVEHHLDSPPPEYLKQFSQTSEGEEGGKSTDMLIQYWEEKRKHNPEDVVHEGKFQHSGSQKLECPKEFSKADSKRLSRRGSRSGAEHLESPHNQGNLSKQSSDINAAGQNTNIPHSESYEGPKEAEGENVTSSNSKGLHQTQNEIFGASGFREAEQEWGSPKLKGDDLHSAGDEKPGGSEDADPTHPLNGVTDQDSQNKRQASRSLNDMHKGNSARPSSASSEDEFQHQEGTSPGETKYALNSDRHQEMEGKKKQDGLHDKQTQHGDQEDHYSRNTGLLPLNLEDLHRAKGTKPPNAGSEDQFEHQDDPYPDHGKGEKMQDSFIEKQIHRGASDPEECFPNSENLEEFLTRNGYKKGASNSAHGNGSSISSSHDQGTAGSTCLWDRVSTHDIGEDKTGHLYRDHSQHIGQNHHAEHSRHTRLPDHTDRGEEGTSAWKLGFFSVPHIVVVGALTTLSVLGKAAN